MTAEVLIQFRNKGHPLTVGAFLTPPLTALSWPNLKRARSKCQYFVRRPKSFQLSPYLVAPFTFVAGEIMRTLRNAQNETQIPSRRATSAMTQAPAAVGVENHCKRSRMEIATREVTQRITCMTDNFIAGGVSALVCGSHPYLAFVLDS